MKYFKNQSNQIFAYESDGSQDHLIKPGLVEITEQEAQEITTPSEQEQLEMWRDSATVSRFQAFQALDDFGLLEAVETWAANQTGQAKRAFDMAQEFRYRSPTLEAARQALGISDEQKDQLFQHAETIEA